MGKLYARSVYQNYTKEESEAPIVIEKHVSNVEVELSVILGHIRSTFNNILNLKVGDYISTDRKTSQFLDLKIGDEIKYKVTPGKVGHKMGVKVNQVQRSETE